MFGNQNLILLHKNLNIFNDKLSIRTCGSCANKIATNKIATTRKKETDLYQRLKKWVQNLNKEMNTYVK